jgi:ABC-2 type transport system permease protein
MKALIIARKDLTVFLKDRGAVVTLFVLPLVFILLFIGLWRSANIGAATPADKRIDLPVVNLDRGGAASTALIDEINRAGGVRVVLYEESAARSALAQGNLSRILTIPAGFSADMAAGRQVTLRHTPHPNASQTTTETVARVINGAARDLSIQTQLLAALRQMGDMQAASPGGDQAFRAERLIAQAESQMVQAQTTPLVAVEQVAPQKMRATTSKAPQFPGLQYYVAGFTVLFVFLAAGTTAQMIHAEKKQGAFRRLLAAPISRAALMLGKIIPNLVTTLVQIVVMFGVSLFLLPLLGWGQVSLGRDPLALVLVSLAVAVCSTSLGVLISALARTEAQVGGIGSGILWIAGAIGGSFMPTFLLPGLLQSLGKFVPHYWANQAFYDLLVRGQDLRGVTPSIVALLAFAVLFAAIGLWRFEYD